MLPASSLPAVIPLSRYLRIDPNQGCYWSATRHPWPCLWFLLPLLGAYEGGILWLGGTNPEALRTGADTWLHQGLGEIGLQHLYWVPGLILLWLAGWSWLRWLERPLDSTGAITGMALESLVFALGLWGLSRGLSPTLDRLGIRLAAGELPSDGILAQAVTYVGAGIYEEVLFRLLMFSGLMWLLRHFNVPGSLAAIGAGLVSALVFSAAHHAGPYGEPFVPYVFLFRTLAGLYFGALYQLRGFGITVGAHAGYDLLVGVVVA